MYGKEYDRAKLGLVGTGDEAAFLALVDRYQPTLSRVAALWVDDPARADALVQQTWLKMLHRLERFDGQRSLKGWLCATLIELARTALGPERDDFPQSAADGDELAVEAARFSPPGDRWEGHWCKPPSDWPPAPAAHTLPIALRRVLESAIAALPRPQRIMLVLRDMEELSVEDVDRALGVSEAEQRRLLHRARSKVRAAVEQHHDQLRGAS